MGIALDRCSLQTHICLDFFWDIWCTSLMVGEAGVKHSWGFSMLMSVKGGEEGNTAVMKQKMKRGMEKTQDDERERSICDYPGSKVWKFSSLPSQTWSHLSNVLHIILLEKSALWCGKKHQSAPMSLSLQNFTRCYSLCQILCRAKETSADWNEAPNWCWMTGNDVEPRLPPIHRCHFRYEFPKLGA